MPASLEWRGINAKPAYIIWFEPSRRKNDITCENMESYSTIQFQGVAAKLWPASDRQIKIESEIFIYSKVRGIQSINALG